MEVDTDTGATALFDTIFMHGREHIARTQRSAAMALRIVPGEQLTDRVCLNCTFSRHAGQLRC